MTASNSLQGPTEQPRLRAYEAYEAERPGGPLVLAAVPDPDVSLLDVDAGPRRHEITCALRGYLNS